MTALVLIGFISLVGFAVVMTASTLISALASLGFGGRIEAFSYVMGAVSVILWVMVYNLSPFTITLSTGT